MIPRWLTSLCSFQISFSFALVKIWKNNQQKGLYHKGNYCVHVAKVQSVLGISNIVSLSNLQSLDISNASLLNDDVWYILQAQTSNQITCLPDSFSQLSSLRRLDLSGNDALKVLTPEIADMPLLTEIETDRSLKKFDKGYKRFQDIFSQFSSIISLTEKQFDIILTYMHNCGMLLWYKNDEDLRPYIFYHIPTVTSLLQVLFTHDDTVWQRRLSDFGSSTSTVQQLLTLDEYRSFEDKFSSAGIMHVKLFEHLLRTETEFVENAAMRVAAKILKSFRVMYCCKLQNEESSFIVPYFCKEFLSDDLPTTGSCVTFHAQLRFDGLPLPQYAYHQLAVDMLNSFSQDSDSITARNNGARVVNKDVTYQLVHDYKSGIVNIRVSFDSRQVCKAWKVLVDITNSSCKYVETRWHACKIGCKFVCPHCGLEEHRHPSRLMNPSWIQYHGKREKSSLHSSEAKHFTCKKDPSVPECLLNPCEYLILQPRSEETQVESDADSDLSDHEDFFLPREEHYIKMEVSVTRREKIKQLFYSNQVT
ncbi:hypothetical protein EB796_010943 [Bugula neritina]|uniref:Uncharacterized protein n=1 Tax=Bugula neritina TaxID=10212 RepID=A0A7J7JWJ9_BUGNE|nr:hypothetical protein EB796_010943 [Bugula neritina]